MTSPSELEPPFELEPNEDIVERNAPGESPLFLWVQTCPLDDCPCRTALVVVAPDRQTLGEQVAVVREVWDDAEDEAAFKQGIATGYSGPSIVAFELDIDSGDINMPLSDSAELSPEVAQVAGLVDGDLLDHIASLWFLGKDQDDISQTAIEPNKLKGYQLGQLVAWDEVYEGARMDVYRFGESDDAIEAEAIETFCVRPQCECNEVRVQFYEIGKDEEGHLGTVSIKVEEPVGVSMHVPEPNRAMLEAFWALYQKRHPNWVLRLAHRAEVMQQFGVRLHQKSQNAAKKPWVSASRKRQGKPKGTH